MLSRDRHTISGLTVILIVVTAAVAVVSGTPSSGGGSDPLRYHVIEECRGAGCHVAHLAADVQLESRLPEADLDLVVFEVFLSDHSDHFAVQSPSGHVTVEKPIDRDTVCPKMAACVIRLDVAIVQPRQHFRVCIYL